MTGKRMSRWWTPSTTITDEGRRTRSNLQTVLVALIVIGVLGWALAEFGRNTTGTGPDGSVFVTDVNGTAALGALLDDLGHPVVPVTVPFASLDPGGTMFIIDAGVRSEYSEEEVDALDRWLTEGGRLIVAGRPHPDLIGPILPEGTDLGFSGQDSIPIIEPVRGVDGTLVGGGVFSVGSPGVGLALAGEPPVAVAYDHGDGVVVFLADGTVLRNRSLAHNAPWVVSLVAEGTVRFDEVRHGFTAAPASENPGSLLAALPDGVRSVVLLLVPVLLLALVAYGRRFGPPEATTRELAPARRELVDAYAGLLDRMPEPVAATASISRRLRATVARQAGLAGDVEDRILLASASGIGVDPQRLKTALDPHDEESMIEAQHMLAELSAKEHT